MPRPKRTDNIVSKFISNGRTHTVRVVIVKCRKCGHDFECQMTTKAASYCIECAVIASAEKRKRDAERVIRQRKAGIKPRSKTKKRTKIPYAGFDPTEKHYD